MSLVTLERHTLAGRDVEAAGVSMAGALLPQNYQRAVTALADLMAIDECWEWADRAEALRSYAKQADDPTLLNNAMRVKARAVRRCGELLREIPPARGGDRRSDDFKEAGALPFENQGRMQAAVEAGLSPHQAKQALRVANVPKPEFEALVEAANPPTVSQLADLGRKRRLLPDTEDDDDFLSDREADRGIELLARRLDTGLILSITPGIGASLRSALSRASTQHREIIRDAARILSELTAGAK